MEVAPSQKLLSLLCAIPPTLLAQIWSKEDTTPRKVYMALWASETKSGKKGWVSGKENIDLFFFKFLLRCIVI